MSSFKSPRASNIVDRSSVADQILKDLKDRILDGEFPRGAKLPTERELVERYQVSGPTVREAIRGLSAMGLADVRHGSGAFVTARTETLIALSLGSIIQLEGLGALEILSVLGVLNAQAANLASIAATPEDHARLQASLKDLEAVGSVREAAEAVREFHRAIALAAHNPLLAALCGFLADLQTELGMELTGPSIEPWLDIFSKSKPGRTQLVEAILAGDSAAAVRLANDFHAKTASLVTSLPKAKEVRLTDPQLRHLIASMMSRIGSN